MGNKISSDKGLMEAGRMAKGGQVGAGKKVASGRNQIRGCGDFL